MIFVVARSIENPALAVIGQTKPPNKLGNYKETKCSKRFS